MTYRLAPVSRPGGMGKMPRAGLKPYPTRALLAELARRCTRHPDFRAVAWIAGLLAAGLLSLALGDWLHTLAGAR